MTPTERAKRSDALYYETVSVNRRVLCDMVANREADLEDARAENDELWALNEHMGLKYMAAMGELGEENDQLKAENDKLRDLALNCYRMAKAHCTDKDCRTRCSHWPECCEHDSLQHAEPCELAVLACELGVEVEE